MSFILVFVTASQVAIKSHADVKSKVLHVPQDVTREGLVTNQPDSADLISLSISVPKYKITLKMFRLLQIYTTQSLLRLSVETAEPPGTADLTMLQTRLYSNSVRAPTHIT